MVTSNDISEKRYFFQGYGYFFVGLSSSKDNFNVFDTTRGPNFLQLLITIGGDIRIDYYQGAFTQEIIWLGTRNFTIEDSQITSQSLYGEPKSPWNALRQYFPNLENIGMSIKVYPA